MSQDIQVATQNINVWDSQERTNEIKKLYAPDLSDNEFKIFCEIGRATGLNPFLRELWAIKYKRWNPNTKKKELQPATIFIGRDGYRVAAQSHPKYDYHQCDAVYENDDYKVIDGEIKHTYKLKDRGKLVGAYCSAQKKGSSRPVFVYVDIDEYRGDDKSLWGTKPATMIKKVAEAQGLRMAFQDMFKGTYDESEQWKDDAIDAEATVVQTSNNQPIKQSSTTKAVQGPEMISKAQISYLTRIAKDIIDIEIKSGKENYKTLTPETYTEMVLSKEYDCSVEEVTKQQASSLIDKLNAYKKLTQSTK